MINFYPNSPYRCEICGGGLRIDESGVARKVTGWLKNGSSNVRNPGPPVGWAHWTCIELESKPATLEQDSLF
jgi:hypothetical protein